MIEGPKNLFWDSCVFIRYLVQSPSELCDDIEEFVRDAQNGDRKIHYSTITLVEIRESQLKIRGYDYIEDFFRDFESAFIPIEADYDVMRVAGAMRDVPRSHPNKENKKVLGTGDAIQLASCVLLRDRNGVDDVVFHTFDDGRGRNWEGRCVSLLSFEDWYPSSRGKVQIIDDVCRLPRIRPEHPAPPIPGTRTA